MPLRLLLALLGLAVPVLATPQDATPDAPRGDRPPPSRKAPDEGRALYVQNCARCHGDEGRGDGPTQVFPPPRNFREGGFSFGNTEVAIMRTIANGIPGTAMTPYAEVLSEEQRRALARYVRSLLPEKARRGGGASQVVITKGPVILRGYLDAGIPGRERWPRGLAVGLPGGLSFALRSDDVRLLAVRRGPFVDRTDWRGRGGSSLKLLGRPWIRFGDGDPGATYAAASPLGDQPLSARLVATEADPARACLDLRLADAEGRALTRVRESFRLAGAAGAIGYRRHFEVESGAEPLPLLVEVFGGEPGVRWSEGLLPVTHRSGPDAEFAVEEWPHWFVAPLASGGFRVVHLQAPEGTRLRVDPARIRVRLPRLETGASARIDVAVLECPLFDEDVADDLSSELEY